MFGKCYDNGAAWEWTKYSAVFTWASEELKNMALFAFFFASMSGKDHVLWHRLSELTAQNALATKESFAHIVNSKPATLSSRLRFQRLGRHAQEEQVPRVNVPRNSNSWSRVPYYGYPNTLCAREGNRSKQSPDKSSFWFPTQVQLHGTMAGRFARILIND